MASAATLRWKRWKERQERGEHVVPVVIPNAFLERMLDLGLIAERDSRSRAKIGAAIRRYLANAFGDTGCQIADSACDDNRARRTKHARQAA